MDKSATLVSVERDPQTRLVAERHLGGDQRITFAAADADTWLSREARGGPRFDLAYVDCRPGKFQQLPDLLALLRPGGLYVVDDLLPQPTWPDDHQKRVDGFLAHLPEQPNLLAAPMRWASGLVVGARI